MRRLARGMILAAALGAVVLACVQHDKDIRIAIAGPMTGSDSQMGADFRNGAALAIEEWNARGGVLGKKVKTILFDDQADPQQAVSVANRLVNDRIVGVVGHYNSSCSIPASEVYNRARIPMITPASTNPYLTERGYPGVFRVCGTDDQQGKAGADFAVRKLQAKRIAIIHDRTTYGQGLAELFRAALGTAADVVFFSGIARGEKDFRSVLTAVREKAPDLIYFGGVYSEAGLLIRQARELSIPVPILSGDAAFDRKMLDIAGAAAIDGVYVTFSPDPETLPTALTFVQKYRERYGERGAYSIYAYVAVNVMLEAMQAAGTTDGNAVADKLHSMEFATALGPIRFNQKGNVIQAPYVVWKARPGGFQEFWKPE